MKERSFLRRLWDRLWPILKKIGSFILNPRLLLCFGLSWMITNGWSYVFAALGAWLDIPWMAVTGAAYMSFLWFPFTPEKLITLIISIFLLKKLFPKDTRTLLVLETEYAQLKKTLRQKKAERAEKRKKRGTRSV
jgi:hypothetical protein